MGTGADPAERPAGLPLNQILYVEPAKRRLLFYVHLTLTLIQREQHPEKYRPPKNWYSTKLKNKMIGPMRTLPQVPADAITGYYETALTAFPDVLSIVQVCDLTGYQRHTVLGWIHDGRLRSFYIGQKHQIPKVFLLEFVASDFYAKIVDKSKRHQTAIRFTAKALKAKEV